MFLGGIYADDLANCSCLHLYGKFKSNQFRIKKFKSKKHISVLTPLENSKEMSLGKPTLPSELTWDFRHDLKITFSYNTSGCEKLQENYFISARFIVKILFYLKKRIFLIFYVMLKISFLIQNITLYHSL